MSSLLARRALFLSLAITLLPGLSACSSTKKDGDQAASPTATSQGKQAAAGQAKKTTLLLGNMSAAAAGYKVGYMQGGKAHYQEGIVQRFHVQRFILPVGKVKLLVVKKGEKPIQKSLQIASSDHHLYTIEPAGAFGLLDIAGMYSGGGLLAAFKDKDFPLKKIYRGKALTKLQVEEPAMVTLPFEALPKSQFAGTNSYFLCPLGDDVVGDPKAARAGCLKFLQASLKRAQTP